jgi:perosamine synthetase
MPVHFAGLPCDMERIMALAQRHGLSVIEDAAHALPCRVGGRAAGTLGHAGAFSFYATKTITTGEGGMLTTDDDRIAERARMMSLHGLSRGAWQRYAGSGSWRYDIQEAGFKYNMTDIAAALGLEQLRRADALWEMRRDHAARYSDAFRQIPALQPPPDALHGDQHAWHLYVLRLHLDRLRIDRDAFIRALAERGIATSVHFIPLHLHSHYRDRLGCRPEQFPVATAEFERLISLPLYPRMSVADVDRVIDAVATIVRENAA